MVATDTGTIGPKSVGEGRTARGDRAGVYVRFSRAGGRNGATVEVQVATSFISHEQAMLNMEREVGGKSFETVVQECGRDWERWLSRVRPRGGSERELQVLYSCLYRVGLFPTPLHEFDRVNKPVHRSPYDGSVRPGVLYTNQGLWDAYRTVYPLLAAIDRTGYGEIIEGFLEGYRQSGWFPRWPSPGLRQCMIGSHGDVIVAEAVAAGIKGFDYAEAYDAIRKNAYVHSDDPRLGRHALNDYLTLGYVPGDTAAESVCWTLDNAHCDWCIAQVARHLGHEQDAADLLRRSRNYRNLWHPLSRLMRPRNSDGSWTEPWREFEWGGAYVEGGPWQHSLHVPHDPVGLAELHGGAEALLDRVDEMFSLPPTYERGTYWEEIHEMTEVALAADEQGRSFGQYAHSNQPVHNYLFLAAALGQPHRSIGHIERVMRAMYTPTTFPGDEDNGEMSAWYLLCAAGRVPACPGSGRLWSLNLPTFGPAELVDVGPQ
jgi:predicted alpha-1,2-mannosidase